MFQPHNRLFSGCLLITLLIVCLTVSLFTSLAVDAWRVERDFHAKRDELREHYLAWVEQDYRDYNVTYTNCNSNFCCQQARMIVRDQVLDTLEPDCRNTNNSSNFSYYYYDESIRTVNELYSWLDDRFRWDDNWEKLEITYDPEYHYITSIEWIAYPGYPQMTITYADFLPQE